MTEFRVEVVEIASVEKHPNADALEIVRVYDYPVCCRLGEFKPGDRAVYLPIDSVVPLLDERWAFLAGHRRIKAKRLRGVFSMGLLTQCDDASWPVGLDVREHYRIQKYEPAPHSSCSTRGPCEPDPGHMPMYTDLEGMRRHVGALVAGEEVVLTEKLHGANARFVWTDGRLWVGSRTTYKAESDECIWWTAARRYELAEKLARMPGIAIYGEVYGPVQDLKYGSPSEVRLALFDALDISDRRYLDYDAFVEVAARLELPVVPVLYRGPWSDDLRAMANGKSTIAEHMREGFVVRPARERRDDRLGRVILKLVGEDYLLRRSA